jgi:hypothetical protein
LGSLNPLEQIRKYLNDKHEREKDRGYRAAAEEGRLKTEQTLREIETIGRALELAERHGATRDELTPFLDQLVHRPLERLGRVQSARVIEHTEIKQIEDKRDQPPTS